MGTDDFRDLEDDVTPEKDIIEELNKIHEGLAFDERFTNRQRKGYWDRYYDNHRILDDLTQENDEDW